MTFLGRGGRWVKHNGLWVPRIAGGGAMTLMEQLHYRWYDDDGDSDNDTPTADQDTAINILQDGGGDVQHHLRICLQELNGAGAPATDDWTVQYRVDGGGSWVTITASSSRVQTDTASQLADGTATLDRAVPPGDGLDNGSGSFFAGIEEDGDSEITDFAHAPNDYTDHSWAFDFIDADNAPGTFLDFRVQRSGSSANFNYTVTPRVDFTAPPSARRVFNVS